MNGVGSSFCFLFASLSFDGDLFLFTLFAGLGLMEACFFFSGPESEEDSVPLADVEICVVSSPLLTGENGGGTGELFSSCQDISTHTKKTATLLELVNGEH